MKNRSADPIKVSFCENWINQLENQKKHFEDKNMHDFVNEMDMKCNILFEYIVLLNENKEIEKS